MLPRQAIQVRICYQNSGFETESRGVSVKTASMALVVASDMILHEFVLDELLRRTCAARNRILGNLVKIVQMVLMAATA